MLRDFGFWILDFGLVIAAMLLFCVEVPSAQGAVTSLDDIEHWVGSGANRAGVVVDWNGDATTDHALVWGFRWDGDATGETMLRAIITADPRLYAKLGTSGGFGLAVRGLGYDLNDDNAFALHDGTTFDAAGIAASGPTDGVLSIDPADHYREGWFIGVWNYATANANPWSGGNFAYSGAGASGRTLADGAWDSWAFTQTFRSTAFGANPLAATAPADFDSSGSVDGTDFLAWQRNLGGTSALRSAGDATGDGAVDHADLAVWRSQLAGSAPFALAIAATTSAPEPASYTTCASAMFVLIRLSRHLRHLKRRRDS
jgi:hypothetical protein